MNRSDQDRNAYMLCGPLAKRGYLRWWHSFTGVNAVSGERRIFFVEYLILNPLPEKSKGGRPARASYVRISAGSFPNEASEGFRLDSYSPISAAKYARKPLYFQVGNCMLSENRISGSLEGSPAEPGQTSVPSDASDAGSIEWNLEIHKTIACHTGILASPLFCALSALDSFWHGEGIRAEFRGTVIQNGEIFEVTPETSFGYADKHWGRSHNKPWLQLASCRLWSERTGKLLKHSALAVDGCCPRFLFFPLRPRLILQLTYRGEDFYYSFANPLRRSAMKWGTKENKGKFTWRVKAQDRDSLLVLTLHSSKNKMMTMQYDEPVASYDQLRGPSRLRAGGEGYGTIDLYRLTPGGKVWIDTLTIQNALCEFQKPSKTTSAR